MIYDDLGEYFTDPCNCNCFAEIWVDSKSNFTIIHWDLRSNAYQHPCDLKVKPFEWQPKEQRKMQQWESVYKWPEHSTTSAPKNLVSVNNICFNNFVLTHGNKVRRNIDSNINILIWLNKMHLKMSSANWRPFWSLQWLYFAFPVKSG